jgi:hypothetical protein
VGARLAWWATDESTCTRDSDLQFPLVSRYGISTALVADKRSGGRQARPTCPRSSQAMNSAATVAVAAMSVASAVTSAVTAVR